MVPKSGSPHFHKKKRGKWSKILPLLFGSVCVFIFATQGKERGASPHPAIGKNLAEADNTDKRPQYSHKKNIVYAEGLAVTEFDKTRQEEEVEVQESDEAKQGEWGEVQESKKGRQGEETEVQELEKETEKSLSPKHENVIDSVSAVDILRKGSEQIPAADLNLPPRTRNMTPNDSDRSCLKYVSSYVPVDDISGEGRTVEKDVHACNARCAEVPACAYFTYWLIDGGCHLSSVQGRPSRTKIQDRTVAARVNCPSLKGWVEPVFHELSRTRQGAYPSKGKAYRFLQERIRLNKPAGTPSFGFAETMQRLRGNFMSDVVLPKRSGALITTKHAASAQPVAGGEHIIDADPDVRFAGIPTRADIVILVLSARGNAHQRDMIRRTWAAGHSNVRFIVGDTSCDVPPEDRHPNQCNKRGVEVGESEVATKQRDARLLRHQARELRTEHALSSEQAKFSDLILVPMVDVYIALPRKVKEAYRWALKNTKASWFVKTDDDSMVRVGNLERMLSLYTPRLHVLGNLALDWKVLREGKWAETNYSPETYPVFPVGAAGHVVSRDIAELITSWDSFEYQGEDTSIGIWLHTSDVRFNVTWVNCPTFFVTSKECVHDGAVMIGHNVSVHEMNVCFSEWEGRKILKLKFSSSLGDQLFQWASLQGIAHSTGMAICTAGGKALQRTMHTYMGLPHGCPTLQYLAVNEPGFAKYEPFVTGDEHTQIMTSSATGYLQSFRYFSNISYIIRGMPFSGEIHRAASGLISNYLGTVKVGIYVSRNSPNHLQFPGVQYFNASMNYFRSKYFKPVFLVGSNDIKWCSQQSIFLAADVNFVHEHSDPYDAFSLAVLSYCDHMILSVGSLGWWSAWLGAYGKGGDVIYNEDEFILTHEVNQDKVVKDDYYPKEWKGMYSNGTWK